MKAVFTLTGNRSCEMKIMERDYAALTHRETFLTTGRCYKFVAAKSRELKAQGYNLRRIGFDQDILKGMGV